MLERLSAALVALAVLAPLSGCGDKEQPASGQSSGADDHSVRRSPSATDERVTVSRCPPGLAPCRSVEGRIVYVERVDPDGDGDAHFVVADQQGITLPGLTVVDVRKGLRPDPLPGVGDLVSAAGPVQTGSYGQSQIHAIEFHVAG
ncbi:MAG TPA: hypothetical protein VFU04_09330 [Solirubrobacterales bacterium]|nr:hypothetical protein [Solirubrobacterales bacterium]